MVPALMGSQEVSYVKKQKRLCSGLEFSSSSIRQFLQQNSSMTTIHLAEVSYRVVQVSHRLERKGSDRIRDWGRAA